MQFVQRYLELQQTRFGDKLRVEQDIEPTALSCLVPTLLLQPVIENAIRHGLEPAENAGLVRVTGHRRDGKLVLMIEDNGVGLKNKVADLRGSDLTTTSVTMTSLPMAKSIGPPTHEGSKGRTGIGLVNLRARLETLYGAAQILELMSRPGGGVIVRIEIPWRPAPVIGHSSTSIIDETTRHHCG